MDIDVDELLHSIYYNPSHPAGYGGIVPLARASGVSPKMVKNWMKRQETYTLHRPARRNYKHDRILVGGKDYQFEIDLIDLQGISRMNQGYKYLLTVIDVLSKYSWVIPLKDKTGESITKAFESIIQTSSRKPKNIRSDKGAEFLNHKFQAFLKKHGIHHFTSNTDKKAAVVERFNRTLKEKMWKYFTYKKTYRYIDVLPKLVEGYNNRTHRSIGMKPINVTEENAHIAWNTLYKDLFSPLNNPKLKVGDVVRLNITKGVFQKSYEQNWTIELFKIKSVLPGAKYKIQDMSGDDIKGTFLEPELQLVNIDDNTTYRIEKIIRRKGKGRNQQLLVKWLGYPDSQNSWISARDLAD